MCAECNITFIGPSSERISNGDKAEAQANDCGKRTGNPGSDDVVATVEEGIGTCKAVSGFLL